MECEKNMNSGKKKEAEKITKKNSNEPDICLSRDYTEKPIFEGKFKFKNIFIF